MNNLLFPHPDFPVSAILVENEPKTEKALTTNLHKLFPNVKIDGLSDSLPNAEMMIVDLNPDIIFFDVLLLEEPTLTSLHWLGNNDYETVLVAENNAYAVEAFQCALAGYLLKPVEIASLNLVVRNTLQKIHNKEELRRSQKLIQSLLRKTAQEDLIGVPTIEGYEFISIHNILRCEGLQKCTRIVTKDRSDIVSSYNLGEFKKLLEPYDFFLPHKSYLVNLDYLKKYCKGGFIHMMDGGCVPVAKRMKNAFLDRIRHL